MSVMLSTTTKVLAGQPRDANIYGLLHDPVKGYEMAKAKILARREQVRKETALRNVTVRLQWAKMVKRGVLVAGAVVALSPAIAVSMGAVLPTVASVALSSLATASAGVGFRSILVISWESSKALEEYVKGTKTLEEALLEAGTNTSIRLLLGEYMLAEALAPLLSSSSFDTLGFSEQVLVTSVSKVVTSLAKRLSHGLITNIRLAYDEEKIQEMMAYRWAYDNISNDRSLRASKRLLRHPVLRDHEKAGIAKRLRDLGWNALGLVGDPSQMTGVIETLHSLMMSGVFCSVLQGVTRNCYDLLLEGGKTGTSADLHTAGVRLVSFAGSLGILWQGLVLPCLLRWIIIDRLQVPQRTQFLLQKLAQRTGRTVSAIPFLSDAYRKAIGEDLKWTACFAQTVTWLFGESVIDVAVLRGSRADWVDIGQRARSIALRDLPFIASRLDTHISKAFSTGDVSSLLPGILADLSLLPRTPEDVKRDILKTERELLELEANMSRRIEEHARFRKGLEDRMTSDEGIRNNIRKGMWWGVVEGLFPKESPEHRLVEEVETPRGATWEEQSQHIRLALGMHGIVMREEGIPSEQAAMQYVMTALRNIDIDGTRLGTQADVNSSNAGPLLKLLASIKPVAEARFSETIKSLVEQDNKRQSLKIARETYEKERSGLVSRMAELKDEKARLGSWKFMEGPVSTDPASLLGLGSPESTEEIRRAFLEELSQLEKLSEEASVLSASIKALQQRITHDRSRDQRILALWKNGDLLGVAKEIPGLNIEKFESAFHRIRTMQPRSNPEERTISKTTLDNLERLQKEGIITDHTIERARLATGTRLIETLARVASEVTVGGTKRQISERIEAFGNNVERAEAFADLVSQIALLAHQTIVSTPKLQETLRQQEEILGSLRLGLDIAERSLEESVVSWSTRMERFTPDIGISTTLAIQLEETIRNVRSKRLEAREVPREHLTGSRKVILEAHSELLRGEEQLLRSTAATADKLKWFAEMLNNKRSLWAYRDITAQFDQQGIDRAIEAVLMVPGATPFTPPKISETDAYSFVGKVETVLHQAREWLMEGGTVSDTTWFGQVAMKSDVFRNQTWSEYLWENSYNALFGGGIRDDKGEMFNRLTAHQQDLVRRIVSGGKGISNYIESLAAFELASSERIAAFGSSLNAAMSVTGIMQVDDAETIYAQGLSVRTEIDMEDLLESFEKEVDVVSAQLKRDGLEFMIPCITGDSTDCGSDSLVHHIGRWVDSNKTAGWAEMMVGGITEIAYRPVNYLRTILGIGNVPDLSQSEAIERESAGVLNDLQTHVADSMGQFMDETSGFIDELLAAEEKEVQQSSGAGGTTRSLFTYALGCLGSSHKRPGCEKILSRPEITRQDASVDIGLLAWELARTGSLTHPALFIDRDGDRIDTENIRVVRSRTADLIERALHGDLAAVLDDPLAIQDLDGRVLRSLVLGSPGNPARYWHDRYLKRSKITTGDEVEYTMRYSKESMQAFALKLADEVFALDRGLRPLSEYFAVNMLHQWLVDAGVPVDAIHTTALVGANVYSKFLGEKSIPKVRLVFFVRTVAFYQTDVRAQEMVSDLKTLHWENISRTYGDLRELDIDIGSGFTAMRDVFQGKRSLIGMDVAYVIQGGKVLTYGVILPTTKILWGEVNLKYKYVSRAWDYVTSNTTTK